MPNRATAKLSTALYRPFVSLPPAPRDAQSPFPRTPVRLDIRNLSVEVSRRERRCDPTGCYVDGTSRTIIKNVSASFVPGDFVALMGASGAGKTTMLDTLAGRIQTGPTTKVTGQILVNDELATPELLGSVSAYAMQADILMGTLSPRESIEFALRMRLGSILNEKQLQDQVDKIIGELDLTDCEGSRIGSLLLRGISGGQKRRVSLGVEMVVEPPIFFADEPTSGLDSATALKIVTVLRNMAAAGHIVICTIHQPSTQLYSLFDKLMLLGEGRICYYGDAQHAVQFFGEQGFTCPLDENPSEYFMRVLMGADIFKAEEEQDDEDDAFQPTSLETKLSVLSAPEVNREEKRALSSVAVVPTPEQQHDAAAVQVELSPDGLGATDSSDSGTSDDAKTAVSTESAAPVAAAVEAVVTPRARDRAANAKTLPERVHLLSSANARAGVLGWRKGGRRLSDDPSRKPTVIPTQAISAVVDWMRPGWFVQLWLLIVRSWQNFIREPINTVARVVENAFLSLFVGALYLNVGDSQQSIALRVAALFFYLVMAGFVSVMNTVVIFSEERQLLLKELNANLYSPSAYFLSKAIVGVVVECALAFFWALTGYWMIGLNTDGTAYGRFIVAMMLLGCAAQAVGLVLGAAVPHTALAVMLSPLTMVPFMLVSGFFLNLGSVPKYLLWLKALSPHRYMFAALMSNEFKELDLSCKDDEYIGIPGTDQQICPFTDGTQVLDQFDVGHTEYTYDFSVIIGLILAYLVLAYIILRIVTRRRKTAARPCLPDSLAFPSCCTAMLRVCCRSSRRQRAGVTSDAFVHSSSVEADLSATPASGASSAEKAENRAALKQPLLA